MVGFSGHLFYCTAGKRFIARLAGLQTVRTLKRTDRAFALPRVFISGIVWACLLQRVPRPGSAVPLIGRNNMKKKLLLAPLMAVLVACVVVLSGCGGPSVEELITEDLTTQFDEVKNGGS